MTKRKYRRWWDIHVCFSYVKRKNEREKKAGLSFTSGVDAFWISLIKNVTRSIEVIIRYTATISTAHYLVCYLLVEKKPHGSMLWYTTKSICILLVGFWNLYVRWLNNDGNFPTLLCFFFSAVGVILPIVILLLTIIISAVLRYKRRRLRRGRSHTRKARFIS